MIRTSQIIERHNRTRSAFRNPAVYSNMKSDHFLKKAAFSHPNIVPAKKLGAESHGCKLSETKFKALNRLKNKQFSCSSISKTKKNVFSIRTKNYSGNKNLFGGESNPGLQRDRLGYSPLYYRRYTSSHIFQVHVI